MSGYAWGDEETRYFYELTPERILDAVEESTGLRCTGRALALNSMENRVYEVEVDLDDDETVRDPSQRFRIAKFYRPGRWSEEQISAEHQFLFDLQEHEIPAVAPVRFTDGKSLHRLPEVNILYTVFPKVGGRSPDELSASDLDQIGRLLARMHAVGMSREAPSRIRISPESYGLANLQYLLDSDTLPPQVRDTYRATVEWICETTQPWFDAAECHRIHGDCHMGNLLHRDGRFFWVDFDDMLRGPAVQDIWLLVPGRDEETIRMRERLLSAYESMKEFDRSTLRLIEPLRALRFVHFNAWIAKRWQDPAFQRAFPQFGDDRYWQMQIQDLREQQALIQEQMAGG